MEALREFAFASRVPGKPTYWVAGEAVQGGTMEYAISIDKKLNVLGMKFQYAQGSETNGDPVLGQWTDCQPPQPAGGGCACGTGAELSFDHYGKFPSRDGGYITYQARAIHGVNVRFRSRIVVEVQPA